MSAEHKVTKSKRTKTLFLNIRNGIGVAERFAHLLPINSDEFVVEPVVYCFAAEYPFILGNFVRVMHWHMVDTASMNVERKAKISSRHSRAFNVPAGKTDAPGTWPFHLTFVGSRGKFTKREIRAMPFFRILFYSYT